MIGYGEVPPERDTVDPPLYSLAEKMLTREGGFDAYDYAKCVWLGDPDQDARWAGNHPWPTRVHDGREYVYSVPVFAGVSPEEESVLFIGKDNWREAQDPYAWLVATSNLKTGEEHDHQVIALTVDRARRLWMQLMPLDNAFGRHDYVTGQLTERYAMERARLWHGRTVETDFEDYEALESITGLVRQVREAQEETARAYWRTRAESIALGKRAYASVA